MSNPPGNDTEAQIWHRRTILVDQRSPAQAAADGATWQAPLQPTFDDERQARIEQTNPYIGHIREYAGQIVPTEQAASYKGAWQSLFDAPRPLVVELGCGAGHFLKGSAALRPEFNYLGIELRYKRLIQAARKTGELSNVRWARAHAMTLNDLFERGEIHELWAQFPDPWPKAGQASKRMVNPELARALEALMLPGAKVRLKSDWPLYLGWFRGSFEGTSFVETAFVPDLREWNLPWQNVQTSFEARFVREGKPCFFLEYTLPG